MNKIDVEEALVKLYVKITFDRITEQREGKDDRYSYPVQATEEIHRQFALRLTRD